MVRLKLEKKSKMTKNSSHLHLVDLFDKYAFTDFSFKDHQIVLQSECNSFVILRDHLKTTLSNFGSQIKSMVITFSDTAQVNFNFLT